MSKDSRQDLFVKHQIGLKAKEIMFDTIDRTGIHPSPDFVNNFSQLSPVEMLSLTAQFHTAACIEKARELSASENIKDKQEAARWVEEGLASGREMLAGRQKIIATVASSYVNYLLSDQYLGPKLSEPEAIITIIKNIHADHPENWPKVDESTTQKIKEADHLASIAGSDGVISTDIALCRHTNELTFDICELRGMKPYEVELRMTDSTGQTSGHRLTAIFNNPEDTTIPTFLDGHNGTFDQGIDNLVVRWKQVGIKITSCKVSRMTETASFQDKDGAITLKNTKWDTKTLI